jgi:hypothetical protein
MPIYTPVSTEEPHCCFHHDFSSTWRLTPASLDVVNHIVNTHPEVPFLVKFFIRTIGIPDFRMETSEDGTALNIHSGVGPIQKVQILNAGRIHWKGLYNSYPMMVEMSPGINLSFKVYGSIPGRGFSEFQYRLGDDGVKLFVDASVPMKEGETPFKVSTVFYSLQKADKLLSSSSSESGTVNRRILILNRGGMTT